MKHKRILIVDDDADFREGLGAVLRWRGFTVVLAAGAAEAIQKVQAAPCQVALIDVVMPRGGGIACLNQILDVSPDTLIMLMTGLAVRNRLNEGLEHGAAFVIRKPVEIPKLLAAVNAFCDSPQALVAHRDRIVARSVKCALERSLYSVITATTPDQTKDALKAHRPDLIVLDLELAERAPRGYLQNVLHTAGGRPVVLCNARKEFRVERSHPGAQVRTVPPTGNQELIAEIRRYLGQQLSTA